MNWLIFKCHSLIYFAISSRVIKILWMLSLLRTNEKFHFVAILMTVTAKTDYFKWNFVSHMLLNKSHLWHIKCHITCRLITAYRSVASVGYYLHDLIWMLMFIHGLCECVYGYFLPTDRLKVCTNFSNIYWANIS